MRPILFLIPDLQYHGRSRQASLLAPALPRERFAVTAFSLSARGPFAEPIRDANLDVLGKRPRSHIDCQGLIALRRFLIDAPPSLVHIWGFTALRAIDWAMLMRRLRRLPRLVVSLRADEVRPNRWSWWDRRLWQYVHSFVVASEADRADAIAASLPAERTRVIRPGVPPMPASIPTANADFRLAHGVEPGDCLFMGVGHFNVPDRFLGPLWAFEIIHGIEPTMKLLLLGDGPLRSRVAKRTYFSATGAPGVRFLGARPDAAALLLHADAVFAGHDRSGGSYGVLEGMAAGRPVVAPKRPHLAGFVRDGETGFLVEPGNRTAYSRITVRLLRDEGLRRQVGAAARAEVEANYRVDVMAARFAELYDEVLGS